MSHPTPPQAQAAVDQLRNALRSVEGRDVDPLTAPWEEIEKGVTKLLGGAFNPNHPVHRNVALMIASSLAGRLCRDLDGFWFPHRATLEGAALGFPDAIVVVSPVEVTLQALQRAKLTLLDTVRDDLRNVLARAKAGRPIGAEGQKLGPADYQRLFDPGFVQFVCLDPEKAKAAWESTPEAEARELEGAFGRMPAQVPAELKEPMRQEIVGALGQLEPGKPLGQQIARSAQLVELLALVHGGVAGTGFAPAELWEDVLLPLLHIGAPESFPPIDEDDEEVEHYRKGADPLLLYVDAVPYSKSAADEDGLLGVFPPEEIGLVDGCFQGVQTLRLVRAPTAPLAELCARWDGPKTRAAVERFRDYVAQKAAAAAQAGGEAAKPAAEAGAPNLLDVAITVIGDLARVVNTVGEGKGFLALRRATEAEAATEPGLQELRRAIDGPRIILA